MKKRWKKVVAMLSMMAMSMSLVAPVGAIKNVEAADTVETVTASVGEEREISFNKDWKFLLETNETGSIDASAKEFDDSAWRGIDLPHDYSIEQDFDRNSASGSGGGFLNGGVGWYRKTFVLPEEMDGKRISINFGGIYMDSTTYVNGQMVGNYPYGYSPFAYDITDYVVADGVTENVISIKVNHELPSSRWYSGSGIYRNVDLVVTDQVHVDRYGTYITTPELEAEYAKDRAKVHIETKVENETVKAEEVTVRTTLYDDDGNVFKEAETTEPLEIAADEVKTFSQDITTAKPQLWDTETPDLYSAKTEVIVDDKVVDTYDTTFGFRWITMDANEGFFLNGEYMKLHGMCMHHDQGALGAVANYAAIERQMDKLIEMGVNSIRVTHNPAADELLEICDKKGLLVIDEAFDCWESAKRNKDYARFFNKAATHPDAEEGQTWAEFDIKNMVNRGKNNPCVFLWSIGNEIVGASVGTAQKLVDWVGEVDPTRPATEGFNNFIGGFWDGNMKKVADVTGVVGFNYGEASYDAAHSEYPDWYIMGTETSSAIRSRGFYKRDDSKRIRSSYDDGDTVGWGLSVEDAWKADRDRKFVMGQYVWTGFDYIGEPSPYNNMFPAKSSYFGVYDTAGIPKDAFYMYQSQWTDVEDNPMVHLLPHWNWENDDSIKQNGKIKVQAYSNAASVELFLNGESLGEKAFLQKQTADGRPYQEAENGHIYLEWLVEYKPGKLEAVAKDFEGNEIARDVIETAGKAAKLELKPEKNVIIADGEDLAYIEVDVLDSNGNICPTADNQINFQISGNGKIVGVDNGDATEVTDHYKGKTRKAYSGKAMVIVQSTPEKGSFTLTATSAGLVTSKATVFTVKDTGKKELAGYKPIADIYTETGIAPELPKTVTAVYSDGSEEEKAVSWEVIDEDKLNTAGVFTLNGMVDGTKTKVTVQIVVVDAIAVRDASVVTGVGILPDMPKKVDIVYNTGAEKQASVTWDEVTADMVAEEGFFTLEGTVAGSKLTAKANIHVIIGAETYVNDIAKREGTYPIPTASFIESNGNDPVEAINDGKVVYTGGSFKDRWIPWGHRQEEEWCQLEFEEAHKIGKVGIDFWTNPNDTAMGTADRITIEYSNDGEEWMAVENQNISTKEEFVTDAENVFEFTPVTAKFIRFKFYSAAKLAQGVSEVHVYEAEMRLPISKDANLVDLQLDGQTIEGFNPNKYEYTYAFDFLDEVPEVTAVGADYASVVVVPALGDNGTAMISVVAEDGMTRKNYTVKFERGLPKLAEARISVGDTQILQDVVIDVNVTAKLQDGNTVGNDVIDVEYTLDNTDIAEIKNGQIYPYYPGSVTLQATVTYEGVTVESNKLTINIVENPDTQEITGYAAVNVTTEKGVLPVLPEKIRASFNNGLPKNVSVVWDEVTEEQCSEYGTFEVKGTVEGQALQPVATVLVKGVVGAQNFSTATPVGVVPEFPGKVQLYYSDGTASETPVVWDEHPQSLFMKDGDIVTVNGQATDKLTGQTYDVTMTVRVSKDSHKGDKFTAYKNGFYLPLPIASFSNDAYGDDVSNVNGNKTSTGRWTNWKSNWRSEDWVGIIFGLEEVTNKYIDNLDIDFFTDHGANLPVEYEIQYYAGEAFISKPADPDHVTEEHPTGVDANWKPVTNLVAPEALSSEEMNHFTFDTVETCAIRIKMKADSGKCIGMEEMAAYENIVDKDETPVLKNILVNGKAIEGFDAAVTEYVYDAADGQMPVITGETENNGSVTVIMPNKFGEAAKVIVTAEDGVHTKTYTVVVNKATEETDVDKADLEALIEYAEKQKENATYDFVVPAVKNAFEAALTKASEVVEKKNATQAEVDKAYDDLLKLVHMLDFTGNNTSLRVETDSVRKMNPNLFTEESWKVLADALVKADDVLADENALQDEIDAALDVLQKAKKDLVKITVKKDALKKLIDKSQKYVETIDKYTSATAKLFKDVLADAIKVYEDSEATQKAVNAAYDALQNAIFQLRLIPDKGQLEDLIKTADAVDTANYTVKSATAFAAALDNAKAVLADENATEEDVKSAEKALEEAQNNLVAKADADRDVDKEAGDKAVNHVVGKDDDKADHKVASDDGSKKPADKSAAKTGDAGQMAVLMTMLMAGVAAVVSIRRKVRR